MNRRNFIRTGALLFSPYLHAQKTIHESSDELIVLTTNDVHSQIDAFSAQDPQFPNMGGFAKRAFAIAQIRKQMKHVLVLDSGDVFQGTPYFNFFKGELEYKLMHHMGYDAGTLGNHDFDLGLENLKLQLPHAGFPMVCSNYRFEGTVLERHPQIRTYSIHSKGPFRIGIYGLGIRLNGLLPDAVSAAVTYEDPVACAQKMETYLANTEACNLIICLSHLGYSYSDERISDCILAQNLKYTHWIAGGHTHTFLEHAVQVLNASHKQILITQQGWGGAWMGATRFKMTKSGKPWSFHHQKISL
jgi:5'-nucleotidase